MGRALGFEIAEMEKIRYDTQQDSPGSPGNNTKVLAFFFI